MCWLSSGAAIENRLRGADAVYIAVAEEDGWFLDRTKAVTGSTSIILKED